MSIKRALIEELFINVTVENIYFSDHDFVRIVIKKYSADLQINPKIGYNKVRKKFIDF